MLCELLGIGLPGLRAHYDDPLDAASAARLDGWIRRRETREPLQYIVGRWPFYGRMFRVSPDTLIPRQETEELCAYAIRIVRSNGYKTALDLCCGTGCIGITVQAETGISVDGGDIDGNALTIARENAKLIGADVRFCRGDLFDPFRGKEYDLIIANPPYLSDEEMRALQPELSFEPRHALAGGDDGLSFYRRIAGTYADHLHAGGTLLMEIGEKQGSAVARLFPGCRVLSDLNGRDRICVIGKEA